MEDKYDIRLKEGYSKAKERAKKKGLKYQKHLVESPRKHLPTQLATETLKPNEAGFLDMTSAQDATHVYDVEGKWRILYKQGDSDDDDKPIGPGMKSPSTPKKMKAAPSTPKKKAPATPKTTTTTTPTPKKKPKPKPKPPPPSPPPVEKTPPPSPPPSPPTPPPKPKDMKIHVITPDGIVQLTFKVQPTDTIEDIKDRLENHVDVDIPKKEQRLYSPTGKLLDKDSATLDECNIKDNDVLTLAPMKIYVKDWNGKNYIFDVEPTDTILEIKQRIETKTGIPVKQQRLFFGNDPLDDTTNDRTLRDCKIKHKDILNLEPMIIYVRDLTDEGGNIPKYEFEVNPNTMLSDVKGRVALKTGIPSKYQRLLFGKTLLPTKNDNKTLDDYKIQHSDVLDLHPMQIHVRTPDGKKKITLTVQPDDSINSIKQRVQDELRIPKEEQRPTFDDKPLKDGTTLEDNSIQHGDTINLEPMVIHVKDLKGKKHPFTVDPSDEIGDIKDRVEKKTGVPKANQRLTFNGTPLNKDGKTLKDCGIKHKDTLQLEPMQVHVKTPSGDRITLTVNPDDPIESIKEMVRDELGIPVDDQRPNFKGKPIPDGTSLDDNGIKHGDTIDLDPMVIYVKDLKGKKHPFTVDPSDEIGDIKKRIEQKTGIPPAQQRLTFNGALLNKDGKTLKDCGIKHKDTLQLEPMEVHVRTPSGDTITLTVNPDDPIERIKDMVNDDLGIPVDEQRPAFNGKPVPDGTSLDENGIRHGDTIDLQPMIIHVRDPSNGKKYTFQVEPTDDIGGIKERIEKEAKIPKRRQRLAFNGTPLDNDDSTLRDYGIKHQDTLDLQPMKIHVLMPDGDKITLKVKPTDTIGDVKKKVPINDGKLLFGAIELDNNRATLDDCGIRHNDTLEVVDPPPKLKSPKPSKPGKKSYLPENWKQQQEDRYGQVRVREYTTRYSVEGHESFIDKKTLDETEEFNMKVKRKSQMDQES